MQVKFNAFECNLMSIYYIIVFDHLCAPAFLTFAHVAFADSVQGRPELLRGPKQKFTLGPS